MPSLWKKETRHVSSGCMVRAMIDKFPTVQSGRGVSTAATYLKRAACTSAFLLLCGCATFPAMTSDTTRPGEDALVVGDQIIGGAADESQPRGTRETLRIPGGAAPAQPARPPATQAQIDSLLPAEEVDANLAPQAIPQFVATVFGGLLELPYTLTPDVSTRPEVISGGTGGTLPKRDLFRLTQTALRQYGIEVYIENGFVTVGASDTSPGGTAVVRGRNARQASGRVVQFFTVQTIDVSALQTLLQDLYPQLTGVRVTIDSASNSLILSGNGRDVAALVQALREIDQPRFAGAEVLRIEPVFLSAENLSLSLDQVLTTEGYVVARQPGIVRAITILPFPNANQILIFSADPALLARARYWVETLDQPAALGDKASTFVYQVRNTDAQSLGALAIGQPQQQLAIQSPVGVPGTTAVSRGNNLGGLIDSQVSNTSIPGSSGGGGGLGGSSNIQGQFLGGRVITDPTGNRILFTGTAADYAQLRELLTTLDVQAPQVAIEVMIAEVTLTDSTDIGVQLFGTETRGDGVLSGNTNGIAIGGEGLLATFVGPEFRAALNASASNNKINILQRPQLVSRSGGTARFQVGTDVPIITSQRATDFQSGNSGNDILQSVQYRQTGVILELKPIIYGDRVDITISQEISSADDPPAGISSPTILNRSLTTQISIGDGWTGVLGGLISNSYTKSNNGIPFLKDIPLVGSAFQANAVSGSRTELLVLITPTILRNDADIGDLAESYSRDMNAAFRTGRGWSYTLTPFSFGPGVRGIGFDLPSGSRASERPPLFPRRQPEATSAPAADAPAVDTPAPEAVTPPAQ